MKVFIPNGVNRPQTTDTAEGKDFNLQPLRLRIGYSTHARPANSPSAWVRNLVDGKYTLGVKQ